MKLQLSGEYEVSHWRRGRLLFSRKIANALTNEGRNDLLNVYLSNVGAVSVSWFIGLIDNVGFNALNVADTLASHPGWTELTNYTGDRPQWVTGAASGLQINSSADAVFTFTASGIVRGFLIASAANGTSGLLWSTTSFTATSVDIGDKFVVRYRVTVT